MKHLALLLTIPLLTIMSFSPNHKGVLIVDAKVVEQAFVNKVGSESDFKELYIQVKQHTYFIKWSESKITSEELRPYLNKKVKLKIDIRDGLWDTDNPNVQSRVGEYVAILKLFDTESE